MKISQFDFVTIQLKTGVPEDHALIVNNLWLRMGLTQVLLGDRLYKLRVLEET